MFFSIKKGSGTHLRFGNALLHSYGVSI